MRDLIEASSRVGIGAMGDGIQRALSEAKQGYGIEQLLGNDPAP